MPTRVLVRWWGAVLGMVVADKLFEAWRDREHRQEEENRRRGHLFELEGRVRDLERLRVQSTEPSKPPEEEPC